jgi:hypothetical protein
VGDKNHSYTISDTYAITVHRSSSCDGGVGIYISQSTSTRSIRDGSLDNFHPSYIDYGLPSMLFCSSHYIGSGFVLRIDLRVALFVEM